MNTTTRCVAYRLIGAACAGTLLLACGAPRPQADVAAPVLGADAYYTLGRAEHGARRTALARHAWELALRADPGHAGARNGIAVLRAEQGDYAGAAALWRTLLAEGTALPPAERAFLLGNLGYALYLQGDHAAAIEVLEQSCVLEPRQPLAWERLAAVLETVGGTDRALRVMQQARALRMQDGGGDHAGRAAAPAAKAAPVPSATAAVLEAGVSPWPAGLARTELRRVGAVVEVRRVAAATPSVGTTAGAVPATADALPASVAAPASLASSAPLATMPADAGMATPPLRLEISNGNGARGMAAAWARRLQGAGWQSVRLTNVKPFTVPVTRIEYRRGGDGGRAAVARALSERLGLPAPRPLPATAAADVRIVLGWDQRATVAQLSL